MQWVLGHPPAGLQCNPNPGTPQMPQTSTYIRNNALQDRAIGPPPPQKMESKEPREIELRLIQISDA
ncbi:hypothetical protein CRENBAI_020925 [Crenichthys baileyi]|uniref:Uncharacterized protein n=1 Tax=Crenichthys baileyi TaxID=28760 RepID=A0AAV9RXP9_9TELE